MQHQVKPTKLVEKSFYSGRNVSWFFLFAESAKHLDVYGLSRFSTLPFQQQNHIPITLK